MECWFVLELLCMHVIKQWRKKFNLIFPPLLFQMKLNFPSPFCISINLHSKCEFWGFFVFFLQKFFFGLKIDFIDMSKNLRHLSKIENVWIWKTNYWSKYLGRDKNSDKIFLFKQEIYVGVWIQWMTFFFNHMTWIMGVFCKLYCYIQIVNCFILKILFFCNSFFLSPGQNI